MMRRTAILNVLFVFCLSLNLLLWLSVRDEQARWTNVPPAPSADGLLWSGLGDAGLAYRSTAIILQNLGDTGGRTTNLKTYEMKPLADWFFAMDGLDPRSDYIPYLASYYFAGGGGQDRLRVLIPYLEHAGSREEGEKWRWLAHAVFLSRFELNDYDLALRLSRKLAALNNPDMPGWAKQMPVFILNGKGDKKEAETLLLMLMRQGLDRFEPEEINSMKYYLCEQVLSPDAAQQHPVCADI